MTSIDAPDSAAGPPGTTARPWRRELVGGLDGSAFIIPLSLGSATLVYSHVAPGLLPSGMLAVVVGLVAAHLASARGTRPLCYAARFFEAAALATMLDQCFAQLAGWGLPNTPGVRIALLCLICACAGLWFGALYLLRADRFTRYIPAPVFAGFSNSIAVALVLSQTAGIWQLMAPQGSTPVVLSVAATATCVALAVRRWRSAWPASAIGLGAGLLLGLGWLGFGRPTPLVGSLSLTLPVVLADWQAFGERGVALSLVAATVISNAAILAAMMFINTTMAAQNMTRLDGQRGGGKADALWMTAALVISGGAGAAPISGTPNATIAATRNTPASGSLVCWCALVLAACLFSNLLGLIPLAAVCGALIAEAWFMTDRRSLRLLGAWLARKPMPPNAREDLALIAAVTASAVLINMVAAVFVGLLLGLVLYAARHAGKPVRNTWSGLQMHSNCARSREDLRLLARHGEAIRIFELEADLFFGTVDTLEHEIRAGLEGAECTIIDWSRSRHLDSSVAQSVQLLDHAAGQRRVLLVHAGCDQHGGMVGEVLRTHLPHAVIATDLDRALELAENRVIETHREPDAGAASTTLLEAAALYRGMDEPTRETLVRAMQQKMYAAGERIFNAGEPSDELMLVLMGSANIVIQHPEHGELRVAGVRRGSTIGEIGFLDRAPRSASVVAQEETCVAILDRAGYNALCLSHPDLVRQILENIALDVAARLRHTNQIALARQRQN